MTGIKHAWVILEPKSLYFHAWNYKPLTHAVNPNLSRFDSAFKILENVKIIDSLRFIAKVSSQDSKTRAEMVYSVEYGRDYFTCTCADFTFNLNRLSPCKHIFACRIKAGIQKVINS